MIILSAACGKKGRRKEKKEGNLNSYSWRNEFAFNPAYLGVEPSPIFKCARLESGAESNFIRVLYFSRGARAQKAVPAIR